MSPHDDGKTDCVSLQQHFQPRPVVAEARRRWAGVCSLLVAFAWSTSGHAAPRQAGGTAPTVPRGAGTAAPASASEIAPLVSPEREDYSLLLGATYVLTPLLALGIGGGLSELGVDDTVAVLAGASMFTLPAVVHAARGNGAHALPSFFAMAGTTGLGALLGGGIGYFIGYQSCPDHDSEECDFAGFPELAVGAFLGGVVGYTTYAIVDVSSNASVVGEKQRRPPEAALQLWVRPQASHRRADAGTRWDGLQLGVTWSL